MSLPTTPVRSDAGCHLSSPSSAPNDDSPQQLTPRSKVKAMLAAIDNESDSEPIWESGNPVRTPLSTIAGNIQKTHIPKDVKHNVDAVADDEQGDSDEAPIVPRGILAARLNGQNIDRSGSGASSEECVEGNAYARIKKKLLQRGATKRHPSSPDTSDDVFEKKTAAPGASPQDLLATPYTTSNCANSTTNGPLSSQRSSPGLFVTPEQATRLKASSQLSADNGDSDSDLPANPRSNSRFLELVAKKRAEREAGEAAEVQKRKERAAGKQSVGEALSGDASSCSDHDSEVDRRLTQYARPTRKASKKALEEMNRETQRMSRNMQLAHQAKTKKKITKESLLARFNFRTSTAPIAVAPQNPSQSTTTSSAPASDREDSLGNATPPTSPIRPVDHSSAPVKTNVDKEAVPSAETSKPVEDEEEELPSMVDVMSQPIVKLDKGKGKAIEPRESNEMLTIPETKKTAFTQRPIRIRPPRPLSRASGCGSDSDSELEVIPDRKQGRSKVDVFDRLPTGKVQEGRSLQTLRALAHLNSPGEQGTKSCLSVADMSTSLQQQARKQAIAERAAKIEELKKRGIVIQTAEEREKDQAEVEDLVDKARKEAEDVMQKEKMAARKKKIANGEIYPLANSSGDDEEYQDIATDDSNVEFSGSDEEQAQNTGSDEERLEDEDDQEGGVAVDEDDSQKNGLIENEATEDFKDEGEIELMDDDNGDDNDKDDKQCIEPWLPRSRRKKMIIDDDKEDGEQDEKESEVIADPGSNQTPAVVVPQIPSAFGSFSAMGVPMGMTQAFAATMADTQSPVNPEDDEQDSMAFLGPPPEPNYPMFDDNDSLQVVEDSQDGLPIQNTDSDHSMAYKEIDLHFSQSQALNDAMGDSQGLPNATQLSDIPDPTQDVGFVLSSPAPERFVSVPQSTVDTVLLPDAASNASPVKKKRGRLQRRAVIEQGQYIIADNSLVAETNNSDSDAAANAFDMMKNARKKQALAKDAFDKKRSEAKGMVEEQAQESEDEYAGLGGASEDESGGEEDEYVKELIDQGEVIVNERQLAAHYADNERARDEKAVEKLFKDINNGMLRRKRGAEFDLSDSDDDAEARQRRKRREFAKMRKALLQNENVCKIAEDPKKLAFLRAIEDREYDEDLDFLDRPVDESFKVDFGTQEDADSQPQPVATEASLGKRKRHIQESVPDKGNMRPPVAARRTQAPKKPATLAEIRESVSFLVEEPGSINIAPDPSSSASEDENYHPDNSHQNPRRRPNPNSIIDRLSLKRAESASTSSATRLAFHDPSANPSIGGFKVPSMLRRATTTQLAAADKYGITTNTAATERAAGGGEKGDFVRRGGTKRSSVNFFMRELEKKGVVEGVERRRKEEREKEAKARRNGLGSLGVGAFE